MCTLDVHRTSAPHHHPSSGRDPQGSKSERSSRFSGPRKSLPRNVRLAGLAERVAQRAEERGRTPAPSVVLTPTPGPVEVCETNDDGAAEPRRSRTSVRALFLGLVLVLMAVAWSRPVVDLNLASDGASTLLSFAERARDEAVSTTGAMQSLVFARENTSEASSDTTPPVHEGTAIRRDGHVSVPGGILVLPSAFEPEEDGTYDVLVHFHGNTAVVRESADVAGLNAAVAIINLGIGSAPYEEYYNVGGVYEELLDSIHEGVKQRGVKNAQRGRVALSAWSAGYGAISSILVMRKEQDDLDAVLIFDGIHGSLEDGKLNDLQMGPFRRAAQRAARGEIYFGMTHSEIDPITYAGTKITADYLIAAAGTERTELDPIADQPPYLELSSMRGAVSKRLEKKMEPTGEARIGTLHIVGYRGETKEHHMAHLFQMGATLLPELVARWSLGR